MEDDTDLRMLVMKRSAGTPSSLYTASGEGQRSSGQPLIQAVGPDFSRLSRDLNRVVLKIQHQSEVSSDCPMHAQRPEDYSYGGQYSDRRRPLSSAELSDSRRGSRGHLEVTHRSSSAEIHRNNGLATSRNNANIEQHYMSLPRRLSSAAHKSSSSASKVDRRQSFQDFKTFRDKFTGPLDFKNTLRGGGQSQPQGQKERGRKGRHYSEPRDAYGQEERQRHFIESDFDFRSPPSTRDNSRERRAQYSRDYDGGRDYYAQDVTGPPQPRRGYTQHTSSKEPRPRYGYHDLKAGAVTSPTDSLKSPLGSSMRINVQGSQEMLAKDPLSPRRVEFADEVFNFQNRGTPATSRPGSRCESPNPKGILRHTISDPVTRVSASRGHTAEIPRSEARSVKEAVRSHTTDLSFCQAPSPLIGGDRSRDQNTGLSLVETRSRPTSLSLNSGGQSLVKIMLPDDHQHHDSDDQHHNDSDDTLIEEKHETESSKELRPGDDEQGQQKPKRAVPPPLADWNRSQSFPPAGKNSAAPAPGPENNLRKCENNESEAELGDSNVSLLSTSSSNPGRGLRHHEDLDLIQGDNESLRVRVGDLERQVVDNNDEIKCLRGTLAECLRKIGEIEVKLSSRRSEPRRRDLSEGSAKSGNRKTHVMTNSGIFGSQDFTNRATFEIQNPPPRGTYAPRQR